MTVKWEYKQCYNNEPQFTPTWDMLGKDGWEMVGVENTHWGSLGTFKRQIQEMKSKEMNNETILPSPQQGI